MSRRLSLRLLRLALLLPALLALGRPPAAAHAQGAGAPPAEPYPAYWQHPAGGRISALATLDTDDDGSLEFALVAAENSVELVSSNGAAAWPVAYRTAAPIEAIAAFGNHLAIAAGGELRLLDAAQTLLWSVALEPAVAVRQMLALPAGAGEATTLLVLFGDGTLQLYAADGTQRWQYVYPERPAGRLDAVLYVGDLDGNRRAAIVLAYPTVAGSSRVDRIAPDSGATVWSVPVRGVSTAIGAANFDAAAPQIGVGNNMGDLYLFDARGSAQWRPRTLNRPVTAIATIEWGSNGPLLVAGTSVGKVVAFDRGGQRIWDKAVCNDANGWYLNDRRCAGGVSGQIVALDAPFLPAAAGQPLRLLLNVVAEDGSATLLLLDRSHELLAAYQSLALANQPYLIDANSDQQDELLLASFGSIDLLHPGTVTRTTQQVWEYRLDATPQTSLSGDFNYDGAEELIIGAADGRLHQLQANGVASWIVPAPDFAVVFLERLVLRALGDYDDHLIVAYNAGARASGSFINILRADSSLAWRQPLEFDQPITALRVDASAPGSPILYVGLGDGQVIAYRLAYLERSIDGTNWQRAQIWARELAQPITAIALLQRAGESLARPVIATANQLVRYDLSGNRMYAVNVSLPTEFCRNPADLLHLIALGSPPERGCLLDRTLGEWQRLLGAPPLPPRWESAGYRYVPLGADLWQRTLRNAPADAISNPNAQLDPSEVLPAGPTQTFTPVTSFFAGDLTGDGQTDVILGLGDSLLLDLNAAADATLQLASRVVSISALRTADDQPAGLIVIAANSLVRRYAFQPNYPPLLAVPTVNSTERQYVITVNALDIERRDIRVVLELYNPANGRWEAQQDSQSNAGTLDQLVWVLDPSALGDAVTYRFRYGEGEALTNLYTPPPGPPPVRAQPRQLYGAVAIFAALTALGSGLFYLRQSRQPASVARRFYAALRANPANTLLQLRERYNASRGDVELFLNLATVARQREDPFVAMLADGLFLLADRPAASVEIINAALDRAAGDALPPLLWFNEWKTVFGRTLALIDVPSLTELSLMRPHLEAILAVNERTGGDAGPFPALLPIFDALSASERVETVDDRLSYLGDALALLQRLTRQIQNSEQTLSSVLVRGIVEHWRGLVVAASESLRGRAQIELQLRTQRLLPAENSTIVLELTNIGRAPAEEVVVTLQPGAAQPLNGATRSVPLLAPGRPRTLSFDIHLPAEERFRVAFSVRFSDRQRRDKQFEYGNLVHVLTPPRSFQPIANPYSPGTPLRRDSLLFFGRSNLFNFIASEAQRLAQQHVLILVGQRRTGKTSALLRLDQHLPAELVPIYIDCQSLGVLPGIKPFFEDIALLIADTLAARGLRLAVPDLDAQAVNPGTWFQHDFVPAAQALLPPGSTLLLVFDEFEALENLVQDGILPPTLFPYLRHLMQHSSGLSFIFVGTRRLEEMTSDYWSVLFNMALYKEITFLDEQAARALITQPVAPNLLYDDLALDKIWRITAGHPYFLQLVCYSLVKRANAHELTYITISDVNETVDEMLGLGEVHFAYIWQRSSPAERILLLAIAHLLDKEQPFRPADVLGAIEPYQIALTPATVLTALDTLVERQILRTVNDGANPLYEFNLGLVGLWIERTKGLSKLYAESAAIDSLAIGRLLESERA